jgi:RND family efflux transporter MFP subunit
MHYLNFLSVFIRVHLWLILLPFIAGCARSPVEVPAAAQSSPAAAPAAAPAAPPVGRPQRRALVRTVEQPGRVEPFAQTPLVAKVAGYVKAFSADYGDVVRAGQLLAEIDVPELAEELKQKQALVAEAAAEVEHAKKQLAAAEAQVNSAAAAVAEARAGRKRAQANYDRWQSESKRLAKMAEQRVIDEQVRDETLNQFRAAEAARDEVEARVRSMEAAQTESEARRDRAKADVAVAEAKARVAAADEGRTRAFLGYTRLTAPFAGVVTARNIDVGHLLQPSDRGPPLFVVTQMDPVRVFVEVPEADAALVRPGAKAAVTVPALRGRTFPGAVTRTAWALEARSRTLMTAIDLPNPYGELRPGMYAYAAVTVALPEAWTLPSTAVVKQGDATVAFLVRDGKAVRVGVQTGFNDGRHVEVLKVEAPAPGAAAPAWAEPTGGETFVLRTAGVTDGQPVAAGR